MNEPIVACRVVHEIVTFCGSSEKKCVTRPKFFISCDFARVPNQHSTNDIDKWANTLAALLTPKAYDVYVWCIWNWIRKTIRKTEFAHKTIPVYLKCENSYLFVPFCRFLVIAILTLTLHIFPFNRIYLFSKFFLFVTSLLHTVSCLYQSNMVFVTELRLLGNKTNGIRSVMVIKQFKTDVWRCWRGFNQLLHNVLSHVLYIFDSKLCLALLAYLTYL